MQLKTRSYAIILLVLATAFLHLAAAFDKVLFPEGPDPLFALNGLGYLGLLGAYFLPINIFQERHKLVWRVLFIYIIVTILAWLMIWVGFNVIRDGRPFFSLPESYYGIPAKIIEIILLALLSSDKPQ
ncbi:MAG: hypothetical protein HYX49_11225 [Chloroflexi bacterium]|nr:hypothetical protein [Chloroflexota bacterium]